MSDVRQVIASVLGIPLERVTDDLEFGGLREWDSLTHVNLMLALEGALQTKIDADCMIALTSVRAIRAFARQQSGTS